MSKRSIADRIRARKRRNQRRLSRNNAPPDGGPVFRASNIHFELSQRTIGTNYGGMGLIHSLAQELGLPQAINERLHVLKCHSPYYESDHVLNLAYNAFCDGACLQDLELRRQDEGYLNAIDAVRVPDPTTAGDFCRRFGQAEIDTLQDAFDVARRKAWALQPAAFFEEARIDVDGTLVGTQGECKVGMDIAYDGTWGYHPLVVSLANTGEVLRVVNRPGNRPSHEGAAAEIDRALALCTGAGFRRILVRGDTDFTQTAHLDRWHALGNVRFVFGMDVTGGRHVDADDLPETAWQPLERPARQPRTKRRRKPPRVKEKIVAERGYHNIRLVDEWVAEMPYKPGACQHAYRLIVLKKNLQVKKRDEQRLFEDYCYFLYLTNDWESTPAEIVFSANDRCDQENLLAQLKGGVRALRAAVDNLHSNGAYMVMTGLAWSLKAWLALLAPVAPGRHREPQEAQRHRLLRMEFRTFVGAMIRIPCQIVRTGRKLIYRLLAWNEWQPVFFRLAQRLRAQRC